MNIRSAICHRLDLILLQPAQLLVPGQMRKEWSQEWHAELWHVRFNYAEQNTPSWIVERDIVNFCLGAYQDALCLSREHRARNVRQPSTNGSALRCISLLGTLVLIAYIASCVLPEARIQHLFQPVPHGIKLIHNSDYSNDHTATISARQYTMWKARRQRLFDEFSYYQVRPETLVRDEIEPQELSVAYSSLNLFSMLGLVHRIPSHEAQPNDPEVILSDGIWTRQFARDPQIVGSLVQIGSNRAVVAGVIPDQLWMLPGKVDAWLFVPDQSLPSTGEGFVLAHITKRAEEFGTQWQLSAPSSDGVLESFTCVPVVRHTYDPTAVFWFTVFLACLALPATTSLPLGEYPITPRHISSSTRLRRWSFLFCKIALLLPLSYFVSIDLAHLSRAFDPVSSQYIQIISSFSICLLGLRWTLRDQRQRCPVCLGKLTHPARVGEPSRNFLGWNGTELMCTGGHGLLHVPEIQTSWFGTQRWLYLDASWDVLFAESFATF